MLLQSPRISRIVLDLLRCLPFTLSDGRSFGLGSGTRDEARPFVVLCARTGILRAGINYSAQRPQDDPDALRPLSDSEKLPPFSFVPDGRTWNIEWSVPEARSGRTATSRVLRSSRKSPRVYYASTIAATGPDGPITGRRYRPHPVTRKCPALWTTSSGVATLMSARRASSPIRHQLRKRAVHGEERRCAEGTLTFMSAGTIRMTAQISEDEWLQSYGSAWLRKDAASPSSPGFPRPRFSRRNPTSRGSEAGIA